MDQHSNNPLAKHFRQPAVYIKLTSNGEFWKEGSLELPVTGEIPVYPMTTKDEITLRTPDALINGTSVVSVIESCCPNIKNAWDMPSIDVDSTLIAIRMASYGSKMAISSACPKCGESHDYDINLSAVLDDIKSPDYTIPVSLPDGLIIKLKPLTYAQVSKSGNVMFEEEKLVQSLSNPDLDPEVRKSYYDAHFKKILDMNIETAANCTESITTEDGVRVTDNAFIVEYYINSESSVLRKIQETMQSYAAAVSIKPVEVICTECTHEFKLTVDFDYSSFFDRGF